MPSTETWRNPSCHAASTFTSDVCAQSSVMMRGGLATSRPCAAWATGQSVKRRSTLRFGGIGLRMAAGTAAVSAVALGLVAAGVWWFGGSAFENLMLQHGNTASIARAMFDESVVKVLLGAVTVALAGSIILSVLLAGAISRPVGQVAAAARRIGGGADTVRVPRPSATQLAALADSFNQMAVSLEDQERLRRELVSNFAHELRTPLTNLQGYLQAMRDGVVHPSAEVFASLDEEVDRLRRLSLSLDALAGDTGRNSAQERVDLVQLVGAALRLSLPAFQRRSIRIKSDLPDELYVRANPDHLAQVLLNLLQNAARYGRESGLVKITAARDGAARRSRPTPRPKRPDMPGAKPQDCPRRTRDRT